MKKKLYTTVILSTLIGSALLLSGGCSKKPVMPPTSESSGYENPEIPPAEGGYSEDNINGEGTLDDSTHSGMNPDDEVQKSDAYLIAHGRSSMEFKPVYFSFDQTEIQPDMQEVIVQNANYMKENPSVSVAIEGNTDERGTNEYNMALGERRALTVGKFLVTLGVEESRVRTVSLGEERPLFPEQTEEAYQYNRRADFIAE